jgi:hypothetical protein
MAYLSGWDSVVAYRVRLVGSRRLAKVWDTSRVTVDLSKVYSNSLRSSSTRNAEIIKNSYTSYMDFNLFLKANEIGIKLEITAGMYSWETMPVVRHQKTIDRIRTSIKPIRADCTCVHYTDIYISFPDGSLKRPDISIFCREPDEQDQAVTLLPEAVVEIISEGYEAKDLEINPSFYLSQGIKDVIVYDPQTNFIFHARKDGRKNYTLTQTFRLECGCELRV